MECTVWRPVEGFNGKYMVSDTGDVLNSETGKKLTHSYDREGYHLVQLFLKGKQHTCRVHRLVAIAYIDNPEGKPTVNHIDENKDNNCVENLEWATYAEQVNHGSRNKRAMDTIASAAVLQLDGNGNTIAVYASVRDAARKFHVKPERILNALKDRQKTACGFSWKYVDENQKQKAGRQPPTPVVQMTPEGVIVAEYRSISAAAKALQISPSGIWQCIYGNRKTNKGFIWKESERSITEYQPKTIPVQQFDACGNFLFEFKSVSDAARSAGVSTGMLCKCLKGRRKSCGGYRWKYA